MLYCIVLCCVVLCCVVLCCVVLCCVVLCCVVLLFSLTGVALRGPRVPPGGDDRKRESETSREFSGVSRPHSCTHETQRHQFELHDGK